MPCHGWMSGAAVRPTDAQAHAYHDADARARGDYRRRDSRGDGQRVCLRGVEGLPQAEIVRLYKQVYLMAHVIPVDLGPWGGDCLVPATTSHAAAIAQQGFAREQVRQDGARRGEAWWRRPSQIGGFSAGASPLSCSRSRSDSAVSHIAKRSSLSARCPSFCS